MKEGKQMKTYIKPSTQIEFNSFMLMQDNLGFGSGLGDKEFSNKTEFDEASELEIDMKQNLWDD